MYTVYSTVHSKAEVIICLEETGWWQIGSSIWNIFRDILGPYVGL